MSSLVKTPRLRHIQAVILRFCLWSNLLLFAFCAPAVPLKFDSLKIGQKVYSNVTVIGANPTDLYFTHAQGISNVKLKYLDTRLQQRFNFDPKAAAEFERQQEKDDSAFYNSIASNIVARAEKAALAAKKVASTSENSIADAISDKSLLGKPAPALDVEKWLSEKPSLEGKFVLIAFWAPWSIPCRKCIPALNALQKKFPENLVVVGLTAESEADVEEMTEPRIEFASGIDTKSRLTNAAGVTSIPYALLLDDKRVVRYQGHPSALDEKKLQSLMTKAE